MGYNMPFTPTSAHLSPTAENYYLQAKQPSHMGQQLLTPEEPSLDSFSATLPPYQQVKNAPPSPVSPAFQTIEPGSDSNFSPHDPPLYPDHNLVGSQSQRPLFNASFTGPQDDSYNRTPSPVASPIPQPQRVQSTDHLAPGFIRVEERFNRNPRGWWEHCMREIEGIIQARRELPQPNPRHHQLDPVSEGQMYRLNGLDKVVAGSARVQKTRREPAKTTAPVLRPSSSRLSQQAIVAAAAELQLTPPAMSRQVSRQATPPAKRSSNHRRKTSSTSAANAGSPTDASAKPRTRAPASKKKDGPDASRWHEVGDFCPPLDSLEHTTKSLVRPEWRNGSGGNPSKALNLRDDPDRRHLHADELELASVLRLPCNLYLLCKRQIFAAKVKWLRDAKAGRETKGDFNKTAAQNACTIDVNKVSKLWTAFNEVGWFDEKWFVLWL